MSTELQFPTDPTCREALATFETFRKLGFPADDIWFDQTFHAGQHVLVCELRTQGKKFGIAIGPADDTTSARLIDASAWWNAQTPDCRHCERIYEGSAIRAHSVSVLMSLGAKGILLPVVVKQRADEIQAEMVKAARAKESAKLAKSKAKRAKQGT